MQPISLRVYACARASFSACSHPLLTLLLHLCTWRQIRAARGFSARGNIEYYGPANVPSGAQKKRERIASFRIGSWWRNISKKRNDPYYQSMLRAMDVRLNREAATRAGQTKYARAREAARTEMARAAKYCKCNLCAYLALQYLERQAAMMMMMMMMMHHRFTYLQSRLAVMAALSAAATLYSLTHPRLTPHCSSLHFSQTPTCAHTTSTATMGSE